MRARNISFIIVLILVFTNSAFTEVICNAPVFYNWEKDIVVNKNQGGKTSPLKDKKNMNQKDTKSKEKHSVYWGIISAKGDTEENAKKNLDNALLEKQGDIIKKCKEEHEGLSRCIAGSYASLKEVLATSTFKAREELEKSIKQDCENKVGYCLNTEKKDSICNEIKEVSVTAEKSKKKGKKGK